MISEDLAFGHMDPVITIRDVKMSSSTIPLTTCESHPNIQLVAKSVWPLQVVLVEVSCVVAIDRKCIGTLKKGKSNHGARNLFPAPINIFLPPRIEEGMA